MVEIDSGKNSVYAHRMHVIDRRTDRQTEGKVISVAERSLIRFLRRTVLGMYGPLTGADRNSDEPADISHTY